MESSGSQRILKVQPPYWVLAEHQPDGPKWTHLNESTSIWFTSSEAAHRFLLRRSDEQALARTRVFHLPTWSDVGPAMVNLVRQRRPYLLLDPETADERRLWTRSILKQLLKLKPTMMQPVEVLDQVLFDIDLYCDESGIAPVNDGDDILIVSAVVVRGGRISELPTFKYKNVAKAVRYLTNNRLLHASFMVKPEKGYGAALDRKIRDYKFAADVNAEFGRPNIVFTSADSIRPSHYVWWFAMQAIVTWLIPAVAKQENIFIENVRIFLDRIDLTSEMRAYFKEFAKGNGPQSSINVLKARIDNPLLSLKVREESIRWVDKFRLKRFDQIKVQFDDEKVFEGDRGWLQLADRLAHHTYRQLRKNSPEPELFEALKAVGKSPELPIDITEQIVSHEPKTFARWEWETGQKL